MQTVLRLVVLKVMHENNIDIFVNPEKPLRHISWVLLGARSERSSDSKGVAPHSPPAGSRVRLPAGFVQIVYEPKFALAEDRKEYVEVPEQ